MVIQREIAKSFMAMAAQYPVVTVTGPRQAGKTTLARQLMPNKPYVNLEDPDVRNFAQLDPRAFLGQFKKTGAILDEIQRVPELLSYIQVIVDEDKTPGQYILTGSQQVALSESISQSLAGRTALLHLLPLTMRELGEQAQLQTLDDRLLHGALPRIYENTLNPTQHYRDYVKTYIERDLRMLINVKNLSLFQRFMKLCASRVGQVLNVNDLCNAVGVTHNTAEQWLSILEASFILFRMQPYYESFGKRVVKASKLYFFDVGLVSYLLDIENATQMNRDPLRGNLFENMVILEIYKARLNNNQEPNCYYYRDSNQKEIDVIFKSGNHLIPVEIKSAQTLNPHWFKNLDYFRGITNDRSPEAYLIYAGDYEQTVKGVHVLNYLNVDAVVKV